MVEGRDPGPDEPRLVTPDWALDAAAVQGAISVETIASLGVEVFGNLDALGVRAPSPPTSMVALRLHCEQVRGQLFAM